MSNRHLHRTSFKHFIPAVIFIFFAISCFAQQRKYPYTLLWRISGKDLKQPSYLFGTMHVKDKRVFNFSDSVMLAIKRCKAFAMEVHPDTTVRIFLKAMENPDTTRDLHKLLDDKEYAALAKKFEERNGYKMSDDMNPLVAESMLQNDKDKPDDKDSFIDAYLYGIARTLDKNIYGLENARHQFDEVIGSPQDMKERLLALLDNNSDDDSEEMIRVYSTGNLDNISRYLGIFALADSELVARNKVMVASMLKYMQQGPLFTAVGCAHLPANTGIIALLRKQGYTVEPVTATFTGVADQYHVDYGKMKWVVHTDYDLGYSLEFPSEPIKMDRYPSLSTWMFPDISNENFYGIYVIRKGTKTNPANREKVVADIFQNISDNKAEKIISRKSTTINGLPCTDFVMRTGSGYQRGELFVMNNMLYYLYMGNRLKDLNTGYARRFFSSFRSFKPAEKPAKEWITFSSDTGAFTIKMPVKPDRMDREIPNPKLNTAPFHFRIFVSIDTDNMMNYLLRYNDYPAGSYLANKQALFGSLTSEISSKAQVVDTPKTIWKDGYEGREAKLIFNGGYHGLLRIYARGNRVYMLLEQNLREGDDIANNDPFFDSFTFTPYMQPAYIDYRPDSASYKFKLVSSPQVVSDSSTDYNSFLKKWSDYMTTSPLSGGVYIFEHATIGKYYRTKNADSLYHTLTDRLVKYNDSLVKKDTVVIHGEKAIDLVMEDLTTKEKQRTRLIIDGKDVFYIQSRLAEEQLFDDETNTIYNSLERTGPVEKADLASSKAAEIMQALQSTDTSAYNEAHGALGYYTFTTDELPVIYTALQKSYPDDTTQTGTRYILIKTLKDVHDSTTSHYLQDLYGKLEGHDLLRSAVLFTLPRVDSLKGYDAYLKLLTESKPLKMGDNYMTFQPLYDSIGYTAAHFNKIIPLAADSNYKKNVLILASRLVNQGKPEYDQLIRNNFAALTASAYDELAKYVTSTDTNKFENDAYVYYYLNLMKEVSGEPLVMKYTSYYLSHIPAGAYTDDAVIARIHSNLPVDAKLVSKLLDSMDTRFAVMEAYNKQKQLIKVPLKYRNQAEFGRLCLYKDITSDNDDDDDEYGSPEKLTLLGSVADKGSVYYAYKFKQPQRDSIATYIGISGPFKPGLVKLNFERYDAYTDYDV
ncbi:MAG TPA: TraB/GumN family protein, partial [Mucilaginibacter sp.]|nr:TraB/GumN family protein [Mucilaginibacter sp.]